MEVGQMAARLCELFNGKRSDDEIIRVLMDCDDDPNLAAHMLLENDDDEERRQLLRALDLVSFDGLVSPTSPSEASELGESSRQNNVSAGPSTYSLFPADEFPDSRDFPYHRSSVGAKAVHGDDLLPRHTRADQLPLKLHSPPMPIQPMSPIPLTPFPHVNIPPMPTPQQYAGYGKSFINHLRPHPAQQWHNQMNQSCGIPNPAEQRHIQMNQPYGIPNPAWRQIQMNQPYGMPIPAEWRHIQMNQPYGIPNPAEWGHIQMNQPYGIPNPAEQSHILMNQPYGIPNPGGQCAMPRIQQVRPNPGDQWAMPMNQQVRPNPGDQRPMQLNQGQYPADNQQNRRPHPADSDKSGSQ